MGEWLEQLSSDIAVKKKDRAREEDQEKRKLLTNAGKGG